ncbi:hypothetical protein LUZ60_008829 [Juncus effusus]|nr:hypothetical protein LUZ60_008829 [Juncus effusus]
MADSTDLDSAMDDLDLLSSSANANPRSFAPSKPSRFRPKPKGSASTSSVTTNVKTEGMERINVSSTSTIASSSASSLGTGSNPNPEAQPAIAGGGEPVAMEVEAEEEEENVVVREIDVFFTPCTEQDETKLYVMQYPLRPRWRPYDLAERCTEVRMMPKKAKMEIDLCLDTGRNNFDRDYAESMQIEKQTLASQVAPCVTDYAVGVLRNNQIYLNAINSVVQMRPVIRSEEQKRKRTTESSKSSDSSVASTSKTIKKEADSKQIEEEDEEEVWVPLEFHPENSDLSVEYSEKMAAKAQNIVDFEMNQSDYMSSLCPVSYNTGRKEAFRRALMKLPVEERIKQWLTKKTVNTFESISFIFAPSSPSSEILRILQSHAFLVHNLWVTKSSLLYTDESHEHESRVRDFILLQFSKSEFVKFDTITKELGTRALDSDSRFRKIFDQLTVKREVFKELRFRFSRDEGFGKRFPGVVREQEEAWARREEGVLENLRKFLKGGYRKVGNVSNVSNVGNNDNKVANGKKESGMSGGKSLAVPETRKFLLEALTILFEEQKVRTVSSTVRDLRDMAKRLSALPKESSKNKQLIEASLSGVNANVTELHEVIKLVAVHVRDGIFVRKPPNKDNLRNVFIMYFLKKKKLKKEEIMDFATSTFKREIKELEYTKVVEDICVVTEDGGLVLKSGA